MKILKLKPVRQVASVVKYALHCILHYIDIVKAIQWLLWHWGQGCVKMQKRLGLSWVGVILKISRHCKCNSTLVARTIWSQSACINFKRHQPLQDRATKVHCSDVLIHLALLCLRPDHLSSIFYFFHLFYLLLSLLCHCVLYWGSRNRRIWGMVLMGAREEKLRGVANLVHDVLG